MATVASAAFDQELSSWQDRNARLTTILMMGRIVTRSGDHLCRVRNVSSGGMLIECKAQVAVDEPVTIELRNLNVVSARVRWVKEGRVGVQFDAPVEVETLLHQPADTSFKPRAPRLGAYCPVVLWHVGHNRRGTLIDVSQTGCRLELADPLAPGAEVRITIPGLPPRHAVMRWSRMGVGGFSFNEALSVAELMAWDQGRPG